MSYTPLFPAGLADATLVCTASGQHFGCVNDLLIYHTLHQGCSVSVQRKIGRTIVHPVDSLVASLPHGCRLTRRPVQSRSGVAGGVTRFYLDGHLIGQQNAGRPYVCLLMHRRVALQVAGTPPRLFSWYEGGLRECFVLLGPATSQSAVAARVDGHRASAVTVRVNGRVLTPRRQRAARSTSSGTPTSRGISKRRRVLR